MPTTPRTLDKGPAPKRKAAAAGLSQGFKSSFAEARVDFANDNRSGTDRESAKTPEGSRLKRLRDVHPLVTPQRRATAASSSSEARAGPPTATQGLSRLGLLSRPDWSPAKFSTHLGGPVPSTSRTDPEEPPATAGHEHSGTRARGLPVTALQFSSLNAVSSSKFKSIPNPESPVKNKRKDHNRPKCASYLSLCALCQDEQLIPFVDLDRYNFRELAGETLRRAETEMSLWAHDFARGLHGVKADNDKTLQQLAQSPKLQVLQVFTQHSAIDAVSQAPAVLVRAELKTKLSPPHGETEEPVEPKQSGLLLLRCRSQKGTLAQCNLEGGLRAEVMPNLQVPHSALEAGDEVWLLDFSSVVLCDGQQALLSHKYAVVR